MHVSVASDLDAEQPVDWSEICERELLVELHPVFGDELARASSQGAVVHVHKQDEDMVSDPSVKHSRISGARVEPEVSELSREGIIPSAPGLLEPIQGLLQPLNEARSALCIARRLLHVNLL